jgi:hypothetical protein
MNINFITIPKEVKFPISWADTPDSDQTKVDQVAQSYFVNWKDEQLVNLNTALLIGKITLVIGVGVSFYLLSIPGIILSGAALTVCFLGSQAIYREQAARGQQICLQIEKWCIEFKKGCEEVKGKLEALVLQLQDKNSDIKDQTIEEVVEVIDQLPDNDIKNLVKQLEAWHLQAFGKERAIGSGTWSTYWIEHYLQFKFCGLKADFFYHTLAAFRIELEDFRKKLENKDKDDKESLKLVTEQILESCVERKNKTQAKNPKNEAIFDQGKMLLLTNRLHAVPQGQEDFDTIMDEAEYWRQNIAIFRSSLA